MHGELPKLAIRARKIPIAQQVSSKGLCLSCVHVFPLSLWHHPIWRRVGRPSSNQLDGRRERGVIRHASLFLFLYGVACYYSGRPRPEATWKADGRSPPSALNEPQGQKQAYRTQAPKCPEGRVAKGGKELLAYRKPRASYDPPT